MFDDLPPLSPTQQAAYDHLSALVESWPVTALITADGLGRTTVLTRLGREKGGLLLPIEDLVTAARDGHPLALEDALLRLVRRALDEHEVVLVDDLHLLARTVSGCRSYPRGGWLEATLLALSQVATERGRRLILGLDDDGLAPPLGSICPEIAIHGLRPADYAHLAHSVLGDAAEGVDFERVHRFANHLDAHQLTRSCRELIGREPLDADVVIEYLREQELTSNVALPEVQPVTLEDLEGVDDVIESLLTHVVVPFENDALARELGLQPKRGVLLAGPPGTGKTTIGRALAHRLRGKFFLVDGTMISGTEHFYGQIAWVFQQAVANAPSVVFIDDSDVIFESGREHGLYRYLLTMLDGLESESASHVCVVLTAMNVANLPPALVRSGRVELWLELRQPDAAARAAILTARLAGLPAPFDDVDVPAVVALTEGFTGADLKRLVEDAKRIYAHDVQRERPPTTAVDYLARAVTSITETRARYIEAMQQAREVHPERPSWFDPGLMPGWGADVDEVTDIDDLDN